METVKRQLPPGRFKTKESVVNSYQVSVEPGTTRAQILDPGFFAHIAARLRPYSEITVHCDDGTLYAKLLVLQAERTWARVHILEYHDLTTKDVSLTQADAAEAKPGESEYQTAAERALEYEIKWKGPAKKWCVIRNADGAYIRENEESKASAQRWFDDWLRVTA